MGTWGTGIYSDDFALDVKNEYQKLSLVKNDDSFVLPSDVPSERDESNVFNMLYHSETHFREIYEQYKTVLSVGGK